MAEDPDRIPGLDETNVGVIPFGITAPIGVVEGDGIKVGEGTVLYPLLGIDTGFVSNVFYEDGDEGTNGAGLVRVIGQIGTGSLSPARLRPRSAGELNPGSFQYRANLRLSYDFYLSGNDFVSDQHGLGIAAQFRGVVRPQSTWSFMFLDNFERLIRSTNFESDEMINRDINRLSLGLQYAPAGRSLRGLLHYDNVIDFFESGDHRFANRMQNTIGLTAAWRLRPVTVLFADLTQGFFWGLGDATVYANRKVDSYPLTASAGIQTLLSLKTTLVARAGYTNGFYSAGPSYSAVMGGVDLGYRYSPMGRVTGQYQYAHQDSINANYYRDHAIIFRVDQQFAPFSLSVAPELRLRHYEGIMTLIPTAPDTRDDLILSVAAAARYNFRNSFAAVLQYRLTAVQTDYRYTADGTTDDPSFARHEVIAGVRAAL